MEQYDARIDAYIEKAANFAKPILKHLRDIVHRASPEITETMKWSCPFFEYKGTLCNMAAFKQHCSFGFWKAGQLPDPHNILQTEAGESAGNFGKLTGIADLPDDDIIIWYIKQAMDLNASGFKSPIRKVAAKTAAHATTPDYLEVLLDKHPQAKVYFDNFSASQKKEYITWFEEAKTDATREKRLDTAIEWISEGKTRHWKYK